MSAPTSLSSRRVGKRIRTVAVISTLSPGPRSTGKRVMLGGIVDHLVHRLGVDNVHHIVIGRSPGDIDSPTVRHLASPGGRSQILASARRMLGRRSASLQEASMHSADVRRQLADVLDELDADLEIWDTIRVGQYAPEIPRNAGQRRVLYADDLFSVRYGEMLRTFAPQEAKALNLLGEFAKFVPGPLVRALGSPLVHRPVMRLEQRLVARSEARLPQHFDRTLLVNDDEVDELRQRAPGAVVDRIAPLLSRPPAFLDRAPNEPPTFVILGGLHYAPNLDGLRWFLERALAPMTATLPTARLLVIGSAPAGAEAAAIPWGDRVVFTGWVDDLDESLRTATALLSPIRVASGIKIKVIESLARGLPVVATPAGVHGLAVGESDGCLVADDVEGLVRSLAAVCDPAVNADLSRRARRTFDSRFGSDVVADDYDDLLWLASPRRTLAERFGVDHDGGR